MYNIIFHPQAAAEFKDAREWYEKELAGLGHRFKQAVLNQIDIVVKTPEIYPVKKRGYRESNLKDFPYTIVYSISKLQNNITISAIFHTSRNPRKKYRKL